MAVLSSFIPRSVIHSCCWHGSMRLVLVLFLLASQSAATSPNINGISYNYPTLQQAVLLKRQNDNSTDVCNQAFPGRYSEICQPNSVSNTLCCIIPDEARPKCVSIFGYGFCCTEHQSCFVDVASTCGTPDSVECNSDACCPELTRCAANLNQTRELVRCEIRAELIPEVVFGTTRPVGGSAGSTTTTAPASTVTSEPNSGTSATPPLSGGAIAGIVTGAILALLIGVGIGRFIFNQRARRYEELGLPPQPPAARFNGQLGNRQFYGAPYTISGGLQQYKPPSAEAQELPSRPKAMKLQGQANT